MTDNKTETQIRLARSIEALNVYRDMENAARKTLAIAVEDSRKAKEKYEELFHKDQTEQVKKLKEDYCHSTK